MTSVAVVGAASCDEHTASLAAEVGRLLGEAGVTVVCGGLGGVMEAACRGAKSAGATTVGILPGERVTDANPWVDVPIPTGMGEARNALVVHAAQAVIAVGGEFGTLSEIALALKTGTPLVGIGTWQLARDGKPVDAFPQVSSAAEAVAWVLERARE